MTAPARGERRYRRKVASPAQWQRITEAKRGPCRVCGCGGWSIAYHLLVARIHGGGDVPDNIVPLCGVCRGLVTRRQSDTARALLRGLSDAEYSYMVHVGGEDIAERAYGIRFTERTA